MEKFQAEQKVESDKTIEIKYVDADSYKNYQDYLNMTANSISRKGIETSYELTKKVCIGDYICKVMISHRISKDEMITPATLHKNRFEKKSAMNKKGCGLITSGNYTGWKGVFIDSVIAERFDVKSREYIVHVDGLLNNTVMCILILHIYMEEEIIDIEEDDEVIIWGIVEKVLQAYEKKQKSPRLDEREKNRFLFFYDKRVPKNYLETRRRVRERNYSMDEKILLCKKIKEIASEYLSKESEKDVIIKENIDKRQVYFSLYLAPIMAALCEYWKVNPFYAKTNIRKSLSEIVLLNISKMKAKKKLCLSKEFAKFKNVCKYKEEAEIIWQKKDFVQSYIQFIYLIINKIKMHGNSCTGDDIYMQYYVVECMFGTNLFEVETEIIYENFKQHVEEVSIRKYIREQRWIARILKRLFKLSGGISRIEIAKSALKDYFDFCNNNKNQKNREKMDKVDEIIEKIEQTERWFYIREQVYLEDLVEDGEINIGRYKNDNIGLVKDKLGYYSEVAKEIMDLRRKMGRNYLTQIQINNYVKKIQKKEDEKDEIKKWVIGKSIF